MKLRFNCRSTGGTSYLVRILKAANLADSGHIDIIINLGTYQDSVFKSVSVQMALLHSVTDVHFTHTISKQT